MARAVFADADWGGATDMMPFIDLQAQRARLGESIDSALSKVLAHGKFILGPEVQELEQQLSDFCGARHAVTCANGTDAISLALMAEGIGAGDTVFVPDFTFIATAEAPAQLGATPYLVDVREDSFNIDPDSLAAGIADARAQGLKPRAVIAVDLFGMAADYDALRAVADRENLVLIADAAQAFGGDYFGRKIGALADYTTVSFFPAKPLGCYGDGGAVMTEDDATAERLRSLRMHGKGADKYDNIRVGMNSRLDTLQAAILLEKLTIFADELDKRDIVAGRYADGLSDVVRTPTVPQGYRSAWAQYTVIVEDRAKVQAACAENGIPTAVYYAIPLSRQDGYSDYPATPGGNPVAGRLAGQVLSLPMHPYLGTDDQAKIINTVRAALAP
jgi:dTDP-4-amino-4,6-dideoxygalactose transaminase